MFIQITGSLLQDRDGKETEMVIFGTILIVFLISLVFVLPFLLPWLSERAEVDDRKGDICKQIDRGFIIGGCLLVPIFIILLVILATVGPYFDI